MSLFALTGNVIRGNQLGRMLGYPTANIATGQVFSELVRKIGIYAATVEFEGRILAGVASIGYRPTIEKSSFSVEVHIFDFSEDIYDKTITIQFHKRLRDEQKFPSLEALTEQMGQDAAEARSFIRTLFKSDPDADQPGRLHTGN